ncbi:MAG TPA: thioredoxin domain-containing protein [Candidatus Ozemobacteraceae bacterium]|nr:thioredoxin domain-containing protein [Candidatus Ozemobacteraceae bacterium]
MKKLLIAVMAVLALVAMPVLVSAAEEGWLENLDEALKQGGADSKIVMVDFTATWCGWCTKMKEEVFSTDDFKKVAGEKLVLVSIDADQNRSLVDKYKVEGFPTILFLDTDGREVTRVVGFKPLAGFLEEVSKLPAASAVKPAASEEKTEEKK